MEVMFFLVIHDEKYWTVGISYHLTVLPSYSPTVSKGGPLLNLVYSKDKAFGYN